MRGALSNSSQEHTAVAIHLTQYSTTGSYSYFSDEYIMYAETGSPSPTCKENIMSTFTSPTTHERFDIVNNRCVVQSFIGYECSAEVQHAESTATAEYLASRAVVVKPSHTITYYCNIQRKNLTAIV